ncbi:hypothetical protein P152DRAFT_201426 [Eremomyces bilateralis CBS 781.70]|uniref:Translation initiation factor 3 N-terminal domain-containing protein n=1 Tax=Eremomyces bilateralis CBS 781.70 TaxID=1392243 RepID=A0A6G1GCT2_9PEZI|nr:uncharacterized protein P152DRAFT_201426 [Eremomyces bilateralis CBS 781.70]KAF1815905.1 hypothetical protein P152DRAFT_201426 [Eremomyces bilateralis CBS 781.70]
MASPWAGALSFSACRRCIQSLDLVTLRSSTVCPQLSIHPPRVHQRIPLYRYATASTPRSSTALPHLAEGYILDEAIATLRVHLINTEGRVDPQAHSLSSLLRSIDRTTEHVIQLRGASSGDPGEDGLSLPLVKVVTAQELLERLRDKEMKQKASKRTLLSSKTLEISWQISESDLDHRCKKLQEFLEEGRKVEVIIQRRRTNRRRAQQPSLDRRVEIVDRLKSILSEVPGSAESKPMDVKKPGLQDETATLFFEGHKLEKESEAGPAKESGITAEDIERKKKAEAKRRRKEEEKANRAAEEAELEHIQRMERPRPNWQRQKPNRGRPGFNRAKY